MDEEVSEYKPITGELRERIVQAEHIVPIGGDSKDTQVRINLAWLTDKLDAIDSIHAQLERENEDLRMKFVNANRHAQHVEQNYADAISALDLALREHDNYVQLPVDANNEVIHLGDDMETLDEQHKGEHCAVEYMALTYDGWEVDGESPSMLIHHSADTWESIIYDAMQAGRTDATVDVTPLIERCKALCECTKEDE